MQARGPSTAAAALFGLVARDEEIQNGAVRKHGAVVARYDVAEGDAVGALELVLEDVSAERRRGLLREDGGHD